MYLQDRELSRLQDHKDTHRQKGLNQGLWDEWPQKDHGAKQSLPVPLSLLDHSVTTI